METPLFLWLVFFSIIFTLLLLDLGVFHRSDREIGVVESLRMSVFYVLVAIIFGLWVWYIKGFDSFVEYITGYLVEKSLAFDNIFVISLIFTTLSIPLKYQHRVLFWGIFGVIVLRAIMIGLSAHLLSQFEWVLYVFAAFMIFTGIKMFFITHKPVDISGNRLLAWLRNHLNITKELHGSDFYVVTKDPESQTKKLYFTPLFLALVMVELTDVMFAVDSVPAIFAITQDLYIVYTSNIFAILGLRALYFAFASIINRFLYLKYSLAAILVFIGSKIFIADAFELAKIPPIISLIVTILLLAAGIAYSLNKENKS